MTSKQFIFHLSLTITNFWWDPFLLLWWRWPFVIETFHACSVSLAHARETKWHSKQNPRYCDCCWTLCCLTVTHVIPHLLALQIVLYMCLKMYIFLKRKKRKMSGVFPHRLPWTNCTFSTLSCCMALYLTISCYHDPSLLDEMSEIGIWRCIVS